MVDANVFFSRFIVDLLAQLYAVGAVRLHWSARILDEWVRNAIQLDAARAAKPSPLGTAPRTPRGADAFIRYRDRLNGHVPDACLAAATAAEEAVFSGVHPKDRHVAATALTAKRMADAQQETQQTAGASLVPAAAHGPLVDPVIILTLNLDDFPADALVPHGLAALAPHDFLATLAQWSPSVMLRGIVRHHTGSLRPPRSVDEYLATARAASLDDAIETLGPRLPLLLEQGCALREALLPGEAYAMLPEMMEASRQQLFEEAGRLVDALIDDTLPDEP